MSVGEAFNRAKTTRAKKKGTSCVGTRCKRGPKKKKTPSEKT